MSLNRAIKKLFFTTSKLNMTLHLTYITSKENEADVPSRCLTTLDCKLHPKLWQRVQQEFGGPKGHTCDLMALDSNAMTDQDGSLLPHFYAPPVAAILWCQFLCARSIKWSPVSGVPLRFPASLSLMGPVLRFLRSHGRSCTVIALDVYPKRYWWPLLQSCASKSCRLAVKGEAGALLLPSKQGWIPHPGIPGDLWAFGVRY